MNDEAIKKASKCCAIGNCRRCPLDCVHNCLTQIREAMNNILSKQQLELVLKRNTIKDLNNKLTEKQSENEKLQSLCISKDVIIKDQQAEIEQLQRNLKQCENGYSQELRLAQGRIEELKSLLAEMVGGENA